MGYIVVAEIFGLAAFILFTLIFTTLFNNAIESKRIKNFIIVTSFIIIQISFIIIGIDDASKKYERFILQHRYSQKLYTENITKRIGSAEKTKIIEMANSSNEKLAEFQIDVKSITTFFVSEEIKRELLELEAIK